MSNESWAVRICDVEKTCPIQSASHIGCLAEKSDGTRAGQRESGEQIQLVK